MACSLARSSVNDSDGLARSQTIQVATTSQYIAEYVQCSTDCVFAIDGSLTFKNPYGYLSAELRHYIIVRAHRLLHVSRPGGV